MKCKDVDTAFDSEYLRQRFLKAMERGGKKSHLISLYVCLLSYSFPKYQAQATLQTIRSQTY